MISISLPITRVDLDSCVYFIGGMYYTKCWYQILSWKYSHVHAYIVIFAYSPYLPTLPNTCVVSLLTPSVWMASNTSTSFSISQ
jgi:hypothetical protein